MSACLRSFFMDSSNHQGSGISSLMSLWSLMNSEDGHDCCVCYKMLKSNIHIYLLLYVDDMFIAYKERVEIEALKQLLISFF